MRFHLSRIHYYLTCCLPAKFIGIRSVELLASMPMVNQGWLWNVIDHAENSDHLWRLQQHYRMHRLIRRNRPGDYKEIVATWLSIDSPNNWEVDEFYTAMSKTGHWTSFYMEYC